MRKLQLAAGSLIVLLHGCGGGGGGGDGNSNDNTSNNTQNQNPPASNTQKPPSSSSPTSSPPSSTSNVQITSSSPAANQKGVAFNSPIKISFNESLDPASVNDQTVILVPSANQLGQGGMQGMMNLQQITGSVTYDNNTKTVLFTPKILMQHGAEYVVQLKNIRSATGQTLPDKSFSFRTLNNPVIRSVHTDMREGTQETEDYKYNANGEVERIDIYESTETDDVLVAYELRAGAKLPDPPNVPVISIEFDAATNLVDRYSAHIKQGEQIFARATYIDPGVDGLWNQTDDLISRYTIHSIQHLKHSVTQHFRALDNTPAPWSDIEAERAQRFELSHASVESLDDLKRVILDANYSSLGDDNVIDTNAAGDLAPSNDILRSYSRIEYNEQGQRTKILNIGGHSMNMAPGGGGDMGGGMGGGGDGAPGADTPNFGPDQLWFTADDPITGVTVFDYTAEGIPTGMTSYSSPGADNNWDTLTDNDVAVYMIMTHQPGTASMTKMEMFSAGPDKRVGNGDDQLMSESTFDPNV